MWDGVCVDVLWCDVCVVFVLYCDVCVLMLMMWWCVKCIELLRCWLWVLFCGIWCIMKLWSVCWCMWCVCWGWWWKILWMMDLCVLCCWIILCIVCLCMRIMVLRVCVRCLNGLDGRWWVWVRVDDWSLWRSACARDGWNRRRRREERCCCWGYLFWSWLLMCVMRSWRDIWCNILSVWGRGRCCGVWSGRRGETRDGNCRRRACTLRWNGWVNMWVGCCCMDMWWIMWCWVCFSCVRCIWRCCCGCWRIWRRRSRVTRRLVGLGGMRVVGGLNVYFWGFLYRVCLCWCCIGMNCIRRWLLCKIVMDRRIMRIRLKITVCRDRMWNLCSVYWNCRM